MTWRWMLFLCAMDLAVITVGIGGGFGSFMFLAYYPALAVFAVVFTSPPGSLSLGRRPPLLTPPYA